MRPQVCRLEDSPHWTMGYPDCRLPTYRTGSCTFLVFISHLDCGVFLWQSQETNTVSKKWHTAWAWWTDSRTDFRFLMISASCCACPGITFSPWMKMVVLFSRWIVYDSFATLWTVAHQALLSMGFPRQEYWNGLPFPSPRDLPNAGIKLMSPALAGRFSTTKPPGKDSEYASN